MKETNIMYPQPYQVTSSGTGCKNIFFEFEEDFVEQNVRCIPMIVRFKLDACGIKLKLNEWSKMSVFERTRLSAMECSTTKDVLKYRSYLKQLVLRLTAADATDLPVEQDPAWAKTNELPVVLKEKLEEFSWHISLTRWRRLDNLQRFVLLKLCRPGHENKNFPKAMKEFGLV